MSGGKRNPDRLKWVLLAGLAAAGIIYLLGITPIIGQNYDDAHYITLAQSLARGEGYRLLSRPNQPPGVKYPPGWPLLLMPVWWLGGSFADLAAWFKVLPALLAVGLGGLTYGWLVWRGHSRRTAVLISLLTLFNPHIYGYATSAFSEMGYAFFGMAAVWAGEWYGRQEYAGWRTAVPAALLSAFLIYLRLFGVALAAALALWLLARRKWRHLAWLAPLLLLLVIPWMARQVGISQEAPGYVQEFWLKSLEQPKLGRVTAVGMLGRVILNLRAYLLAALPGALFPTFIQTTAINMPAALRFGSPILAVESLLALVVGGSVIGQILLRRTVGDWYMAIYLGIALLWPWEPVRFTVPLIPLLWEALFFMGGMFARDLRRLTDSARIFLLRVWFWNNAFLVVWALFLSINVVLLARYTWNVRQTAVASPQWQARLQLFDWIEANTEPDDLLAALDDFQLYLYTGRTAVRQFDAGFLQDNGVDYVVLIPYGGVVVEGDLSRIRFGPVQAANSHAFTRVYQDDAAGIELFGVNHEALPQAEKPSE